MSRHDYRRTHELWSREMKVISAPDFRTYVPYQVLLADALKAHGVETIYQMGYRRGLPLYRGIKGLNADLLHLHFPYYYFIKYSDYLSRLAKVEALRKLRFFLDLHLATTGLPMVYSVHDLLPVNRRVDFLIRLAVRHIFFRASAVIAHSAAVRDEIIGMFGVAPAKCSVILHGDISAGYGEPLPRDVAREKLGLNGEKLCLSFGAIEPYKGIDEILAFWRRERPACLLAIVGRGHNEEYLRALEASGAGLANVIIRTGHQSDEDLRLWFSAADCVVLNYRRIYTSGNASLARSWGLPLLLPAHVKNLELHEPHPSIFRYENVESDFRDQLASALLQPRDYQAAAPWRKATGWDTISTQTFEVYRRVVPKGVA